MDFLKFTHLGEECFIRTRRSEDIPALVDYIFNSSKDFLSQIGFDVDLLPSRTEMNDRLTSGIQSSVTLSLEVGGKLIGHTSLEEFKEDDGSLTHLLHFHIIYPEYRKKGYGSAFAQGATKVFASLYDLKTICAEVVESNPAICKMLERIGGQKVATFERPRIKLRRAGTWLRYAFDVSKLREPTLVQKREHGFLQSPWGKIFYWHVGNNPSKTPIVVLHGGPGGACRGMRPLEALSHSTGCDIIFYDQLGGGLSDRIIDSTLMTTARFAQELEWLRIQWGLESMHLLGHSWGTMLAVEYAQSHPEVVASLVLSSPCLIESRWSEDAVRLKQSMGPEWNEKVLALESSGQTGTETYAELEKQYFKSFVSRGVPENTRETAIRRSRFGVNIYHYMWGPSEFTALGNLKQFDKTEALKQVKCPTLFMCGRFDEATPESTAYYASLVPGSKMHVFEQSSHCAYLEETSNYLEETRNFYGTSAD